MILVEHYWFPQYLEYHMISFLVEHQMLWPLQVIPVILLAYATQSATPIILDAKRARGWSVAPVLTSEDNEWRQGRWEDGLLMFTYVNDH